MIKVNLGVKLLHTAYKLLKAEDKVAKVYVRNSVPFTSSHVIIDKFLKNINGWWERAKVKISK